MSHHFHAKALREEQKDQFNHFAKNHYLGSIHQTWEWGVFQSKSPMRDKFWALQVCNAEGNVKGSALVIKQKLPFGKCWLYIPRGPLVDYQGSEDELKALLVKIAEIAREEKAVFLRIDPALTEDHKHDEVSWFNFKNFGFRKAHAHYQPENTLILDLTLSEQEILAQMKPKGRYNIKVATKNGVKVRVSTGNDQDIEAFYKLLQETTTRDGFSGHGREYYENMLKILGKDQVKLYLAEYQGEIIAGIIVTFFKDTAIYYFGASGGRHRNVMAPYLLQWEAILEAKKAGLKFYDFLGIAPENAVNHSWAGVTDFKLKFGGKRINFYPAQELAYKPFWYYLMLLRKKLKK